MHFRNEAAQLMSSEKDDVSPPPPKIKPPIKQFLCSYSMLFQMAMTTIITLLSLMIINNTASVIKADSEFQKQNVVKPITIPQGKP
jgi:hypothetical protein